MPRTQLSARLGANNSIYDHLEPVKVKRSEFPLSEKADFHCDAGPIVPFYLAETLPNDTFEISIRYLLRSFPMVVAPFTSYRIRFHFYYTKLVDLWRGAHTLLTKGNKQNLSLTVPTMNPYGDGYKSFVDQSSAISYSVPQSLSAYLDFRPRRVPSIQATDNGYNQPYAQCAPVSSSTLVTPHAITPYGGVSALPFLFYQKIYRSAYVIPNLLQDNEIWFPNDLTNGWRIDYDKSNIVASWFSPTKLPSQTVADYASGGSIPAPHPSPSVSDRYIELNQLRYALFEDDRFTTSIPSALRGNAPVIDVSGSAQILDPEVKVLSKDGTYKTVAFGGETQTGVPSLIDVFKMSGTLVDYSNSNAAQSNVSSLFGGSRFISNGSILFKDSSGGSSDRLSVPTTGNNLRIDPNVIVNGLSFSANQLRELISLSVWQERNERIQAGDYNQFIYAHFRYDPQSDDHEPVYIGGASDVLSFGEVVQTSETTSQSPLGHSAGNAMSQGAANIARFTCHDYGYIMGVMFIQPETVYSQTVKKLWFRRQQEDFYFPEDEGLGLEEVLNREIFPTGAVSDNALFGYNERNTEYKAGENHARGFFAINPDQDGLLGSRDFAPFSQSRYFNSQPSLSHQFVVMSPENMRRDAFAAPSMPEFRLSVATQIRAIRPMSYRNVPNTFGF